METTIAAISTAMNSSGIGIVRISGKDSINIISKIYRSKNGKKDITKSLTHTIHYGYIYDDEELIDEVLVMFMKAPKTYTGEDTIEIDCHGGIYALQRVLSTVIKYGARLADPGEFTKRAFLNGKMDLSQAEAVMDIIQSKNQYALRSSLKQLKGSIKNTIIDIRKNLLYHLAFIESALDDPEHYTLDDQYNDELMSVLKNEYNKIEKLVSGFSDGKIIREGIKTVILGKPNAGKSSVLNLLIGENKAIVTDIAGTTRDIIEEYINLDGIALRILDTAGIRNTSDPVERIGVEKTFENINDADLLLYVVDSSTGFDENDDKIIDLCKDKKTIIIYNKTDLKPVIKEEDIQVKLNKPIVLFSAVNEKGMEELKSMIKKMFYNGSVSFNDEVYITNARHKKALDDAKKSLQLVMNSIEMGMPEDFYSIDLMDAYKSLGLIIGESAGEDLVNEIFSKFCMGK